MFNEEYENYYEPSEADLILLEYQEKVKSALLKSVKSDIESIKSENERLKEENKKLKDKKNEIERRQRELKYKEDNLKREVEKEFYESNIGETLKRYIENCELWFADSVSYQKEKCNLCDENRQLSALYPNGKNTTTSCDCANFYSIYEPCATIERTIRFYKKNSDYSSERKFYLTSEYIPSKKSSNYDFPYSEFKICHIVDEFNDNVKEIYEGLHYGEKLGFKIKKDCQQFCDWLNEKCNKGLSKTRSK